MGTLAELLAPLQAVSGPGCTREGPRTLTELTGAVCISLKYLFQVSEQFSVTKAHMCDMCAVRLIWQGVNCFPEDRVWLTSQHPHFSLLLLSFTHGLVQSNICDMIHPSFCGENKVAQGKAKLLSSISTV